MIGKSHHLHLGRRFLGGTFFNLHECLDKQLTSSKLFEWYLYDDVIILKYESVYHVFIMWSLNRCLIYYSVMSLAEVVIPWLSIYIEGTMFEHWFSFRTEKYLCNYWFNLSPQKQIMHCILWPSLIWCRMYNKNYRQSLLEQKLDNYLFCIWS